MRAAYANGGSPVNQRESGGVSDRNSTQEVWNQMFLLALFRCSKEPFDNLKIQKVVFISEDEGRKKGIAVADFKFFRYDLGPYSKALANEVRRLVDFGFIDPETLQPTKRGKYILEYLTELSSESETTKASLDILDAVCKEYGSIKSSRLVDTVYRRNVRVSGLGGTEMRVRDIPPCTDIIDPIRDGLQAVAEIPEDLLEILEVELSLTAEDVDPDNPENVRLARSLLDSALAS